MDLLNDLVKDGVFVGRRITPEWQRIKKRLILNI
jgi:hypothetical protein